MTISTIAPDGTARPRQQRDCLSPFDRLRVEGGHTSPGNRPARSPRPEAIGLSEEPTTAVVQRYLDAPAGDAPAEPIIRELMDRSIRRLERLCGSMLHGSYPRLT